MMIAGRKEQPGGMILGRIVLVLTFESNCDLIVVTDV
jgi:hypothetical protein